MKIQTPTQCPSCAGDLVFENSILYCRNIGCSAQGHKTVEHFAKSMKILGLGPKTIESLDFCTITEIYEASENVYVMYLGEATGRKVFKNVENSKTASLNAIIAAAGIPLVGRTAADKLCAEFEDIWEIRDNKERVPTILGPKTGESFIKWLDTGDWEQWPFSFKSEKQKIINGPKVCITGRLTTFKTKALAGKFLSDLGYRVVPNVTKDLDILVNESGIESSKTTKARANGTRIITNIMELK